MTIITSVNVPVLDTIDPSQGFARVRVVDSDIVESLNEVVIQLKLVSLKLDCLQPNDEISVDDLDTDEG